MFTDENVVWKRYFYIESACFHIKHATFLLKSLIVAVKPQFFYRNRVFLAEKRSKWDKWCCCFCRTKRRRRSAHTFPKNPTKYKYLWYKSAAWISYTFKLYIFPMWGNVLYTFPACVTFLLQLRTVSRTNRHYTQTHSWLSLSHHALKCQTTFLH